MTRLIDWLAGALLALLCYVMSLLTARLYEEASTSYTPDLYVFSISSLLV